MASNYKSRLIVVILLAAGLLSLVALQPTIAQGVTYTCGEFLGGGTHGNLLRITPAECGVPADSVNIVMFVTVLEGGNGHNFEAWVYDGVTHRNGIGFNTSAAIPSYLDTITETYGIAGPIEQNTDYLLRVVFMLQILVPGGGGTPQPTPTMPDIENDPDYETPPTAIADVPLPVLENLPLPPAPPTTSSVSIGLPDVSLADSEAYTLPNISTSPNITFPTVSTSTGGGGGGGLGGITSIITGANVGAGLIISYGNQLANIAAVITNATATMTLEDAPESFVPQLPRPMANVGWNFRLMSENPDNRYSITAWVTWLGQMLAIPFAFIKGLLTVLGETGPIGLFIGWVLVMAVIVAFFWAFDWIKDLIMWVIELLYRLWEAIPLN